MNDGSVIQGNSRSFSPGGGVSSYGGIFNMNNGAVIRNNHATFGGGVSGHGGIFNMNGGEITGNNAVYGGGGYYASFHSIFNMSGGSITNNTAENGGGAFIGVGNGNVLRVGGDAKIEGNNNSGVPNNVYLSGNGRIELGTGASPGNGVAFPSSDMKIHIQSSGAIVQSGIDFVNIDYFHPDDTNKIKNNFSGQLFISDSLTTAQEKFYKEVAEYGSASFDTVVTVDSSFILPVPVIIPVNSSGATLTIKSGSAIQTLTRGCFENDNAHSGLIMVSGRSKLLLEDIIIDGNKTSYPDNVASLVSIYDNDTTFTMGNGVILRNNNAEFAGAVYNDSGIFNMTGGEIYGNSARYASGVSGANIKMSGGNIFNNSADFHENSAAVNCVLVTIGGTAKIWGNIANNAPSNLYIREYATVILGDGTPATDEVPAPASGMEIWVRTDTNNAGDVIVESGASTITNAADYFYADDPNLVVIQSGDQLVLSAAIPGSPDNPFRIYDEDDLRAVGKGQYTDKESADRGVWALDSYYKLMNDFTLVNDWVPIGDAYPDDFNGHFNGNNKTVTGLKITTGGNAGLFFSLRSTATVRNLRLEGVEITGTGDNLGAIAGTGSAAIDNCYVSGSVTSSTTGQYIGGLVGMSSSATITNSFFDGIVSGSNNNVGGLVGSASGNITIGNSYVSASVTGVGNVGGLLGNATASVTIYNSCVSGDVTGSSNNVGGLVGNAASAAITNCVALSESVTITSGNSTIGRIIGSVTPGNLNNANNYAWSGTKVIIAGGEQVITGAADDKDGEPIDTPDIKTPARWPAVFSAAPWNWTDTSKMPRSNNHPAQDWPAYIDN